MLSTDTNFNGCTAVEALLSISMSSSISKGSGSRRTSGEFPSTGGGAEASDDEYRPDAGHSRRKATRQPPRTYGGGASLARATNSNGGAEAGIRATGNASVTDGNGGGSLMHLNMQKETLNRTLFGHYTMIYEHLSQLLTVTTDKSLDSVSSSKTQGTTKPLPSSGLTVAVDIARPPAGAPSMKALATHAVASCILATSPAENPHSTLRNHNQTFGTNSKQQEIPQSDWYDGVEYLSPRYLPNLLRFHVIEIIAQSICSNGIDCNLGSILAGLCIERGGVREAEVIIRAILCMDQTRGVGCIYTYLIRGSQKERDIALAARGWCLLKDFLLKMLPEVGLSVIATTLCGNGNSYLREKAWKDWMYASIPEAREFFLESMRLALGVWGPCGTANTRMRLCRMDKLRKKHGVMNINSRREVGVSLLAVRKLRGLVYGNHVLYKSEMKKIHDMILEWLDIMAKGALGLVVATDSQRKESMDALIDLVKGFMWQSAEVKEVVQGIWGGEVGSNGKAKEGKGLYPKDTKVLILLFVLAGLGQNGDADYDMMEEVARQVAMVLDEEKYAALAAAKAAAKEDSQKASSHYTAKFPSDDTFMEGIVDNLIDFYTSDEVTAGAGKEGVRKLVKALMDMAFPEAAPSPTNCDPTDKTTMPETPTPKVPKPTGLSPNDEETQIRYYTSKLALLLASRFSALQEMKYSVDWVEWIESIERKVLLCPIPTPVRKPSHYYRVTERQGEKSAEQKEKEKGDHEEAWNFEEAFGIWVLKPDEPPEEEEESQSASREEAERRAWILGGVVLGGRSGRRADYERFDDMEDDTETLDDDDETIPNGQKNTEASLSSGDEEATPPRRVTRSQTRKKACPPAPKKPRRSSTIKRGDAEYGSGEKPKKSMEPPRRTPSTRAAKTGVTYCEPVYITSDGNSDEEVVSVEDSDEEDASEEEFKLTSVAAVEVLSPSPPERSSTSKEQTSRMGTARATLTPVSKLNKLKGRTSKEKMSLLDAISTADTSPLILSRNENAKRIWEDMSTKNTVTNRRNFRKRPSVSSSEDSGNDAGEEGPFAGNDTIFGSRKKTKVSSGFSAGIGLGSNLVPRGQGYAHGDVFAAGNKWELGAKPKKSDRGNRNSSNITTVGSAGVRKRAIRRRSKLSGSGVYSSPPESGLSDVADEEMADVSGNDEETEAENEDTEFFVSPPDSQSGKKREGMRLRRRSGSGFAAGSVSASAASQSQPRPQPREALRTTTDSRIHKKAQKPPKPAYSPTAENNHQSRSVRRIARASSGVSSLTSLSSSLLNSSASTSAAVLTAASQAKPTLRGGWYPKTELMGTGPGRIPEEWELSEDELTMAA